MDASDSPTRRFGKRAFLNAVVVLAAIVVGIFCWYASTLDRYVRNVGIIILDDDAKHVHLQIKKGPWLATVAPGRAAEIEPGVYEIEAIAAEGYKVTAIGQHRRSHPFMASGLNMPGPSWKLTLARGEEVRVKIKTAAAQASLAPKASPTGSSSLAARIWMAGRYTPLSRAPGKSRTACWWAGTGQVTCTVCATITGIFISA